MINVKSCGDAAAAAVQRLVTAAERTSASPVMTNAARAWPLFQAA